MNGVLLGYAMVIAVASLLPSTGDSELVEWHLTVPMTVRHAHFPAYAILVGLALTANAWSARRFWSRIAGIAAACFGFGVFLEIVQGIAIPGRSATLSDIAANGAGIVAGTTIWMLVHFAANGQVARMRRESKIR